MKQMTIVTYVKDELVGITRYGDFGRGLSVSAGDGEPAVGGRLTGFTRWCYQHAVW